MFGPIPRLALVCRLTTDFTVTGDPQAVPERVGAWLRELLHEIAPEFDALTQKENRLAVLSMALLGVADSELLEKEFLPLIMKRFREESAKNAGLNFVRVYVRKKGYASSGRNVEELVFLVSSKLNPDRAVTITVRLNQVGGTGANTTFAIRVRIYADLGYQSRMQMWNRVLQRLGGQRVKAEFETDLDAPLISEPSGSLLLLKLLELAPEAMVAELTGKQFIEMRVSMGADIDEDGAIGQGPL